MFKQITILGPGLLGASLLKAAKARGLCQSTAAWSRRAETRAKCEGQPWCDAVFADARKAVAKADLVIACTPVDTIVPLLEEIAPKLKAGALVTDVGSTKSLICRLGRAALPKKVAFVGSHPMAGSEKGGLEHANAELFQSRACFVTPLVDTPAKDVDRVTRFWKALGMEVASTTPEKHDEIVAHLSHLPHLLASAYCAYLGTRDPHWVHYAGPGLRDTTRVAAGDPKLWMAIAMENREEILRALDGLETELLHLRSALRNSQPIALQHLLERGRDFRARLRPLGEKC
ncbi:MAG TPA: prephenate dehydrogenase/arogenate dehydrogenase family protein [Opitutales bacterium]|jgi:cyclohexadieny/prephenate dehydrogenase|nr:prephenate dehydrogenase/arogenate dehydrogenase family protein [Opitutales bacterium]